MQEICKKGFSTWNSKLPDTRKKKTFREKIDIEKGVVAYQGERKVYEFKIER